MRFRIEVQQLEQPRRGVQQVRQAFHRDFFRGRIQDDTLVHLSMVLGFVQDEIHQRRSGEVFPERRQADRRLQEGERRSQEGFSRFVYQADGEGVRH